MKRVLDYTIEKSCTIQSYLNYLHVSHDLISALKKPPCDIQVNHQHQNVLYQLNPGDVLSLIFVEEDDAIEPRNMPLTIVYEDEDVLVIDKPPLMPVHPSRFHPDDSIANALAYYYQSRNENTVFHCINRLDSDTSGLVLIAKHRFAASLLNQNRPEKEYLALCCGRCGEFGSVYAPIKKMANSMKRIIDTDGDRACTHYRLLKYDEKQDVSLLALTLQQGRTHQIRCHMAFIGHPLSGDRLYNEGNQQTKRQALHCHILSFIHPISHLSLQFESKLPEDINLVNFS